MVNPTNSNVVCDDAKFISKYFPGLYRNNEMLKTAYKSLEASPLTQRVFTKPPTVTIINLVQPQCSNKMCAHAKFFRILKSSLVELLN